MDHTCPDGECWRPVPGWEPRYFVSCIGRVRSDKPTGSRLLRPGYTGAGHRYPCVLLYLNGTKQQFTIHRLMVETFVGPVPPGAHVRHLNDVPTDNRLSNLEIGTPRENWGDRARNGTHGKKLTGDEAAEVLRLRALGVARKEIAARFGVSPQSVSNVFTGRSWPHLQPAASPAP